MLRTAWEAAGVIRDDWKPLLGISLVGCGLLSAVLWGAALVTGLLFFLELRMIAGGNPAGVLSGAGAAAVGLAVLVVVIHVLVFATSVAFVAGAGTGLRFALRRAAARAGVVLPVALLAGAALAVLWTALLLGAGLLGGLAGDARAATVIFGLLTLAWLFVALGWVVVVPVAVVEELGTVATLRSAWRSMDGQRLGVLLALGIAYGLAILCAVLAEFASDVCGLVHPFARLSLLFLLQTVSQAYLAVVVALLYQRLRPVSADAVAGDADSGARSSPPVELGLGVALRALVEALVACGIVIALGFALGSLTGNRDAPAATGLFASAVFWIVVVRSGWRARGPVPVLLTALALATVRFAVVFTVLTWSDYVWMHRIPRTDLILAGLSKLWSAFLIETLLQLVVLSLMASVSAAYRRLRGGNSSESQGEISPQGA